jgi:hypothetical protein
MTRMILQQDWASRSIPIEPCGLPGKGDCQPMDAAALGQNLPTDLISFPILLKLVN